jgi:hypothetical protein
MADELSEKPHYYLGAGEIMFVKQAEEEVGVTRVNAMLLSETGNITAAEIGKLQQMMQMVFLRRLDDEQRANLTIVDVVVYGISYLGQMTSEEFHKEPEQPAAEEAAIASVPKVKTPFD